MTQDNMKAFVNIIFFGSTDDSVIVANALHQFAIGNLQFTITCVVTQPPKAVGRNQLLTPTPVEIWAKAHNIAVLSFPTNSEKSWLFENEQTVIDTLAPFQPDLLVSACYGQKIPAEAIAAAKYGGINVHPSILPRWRGGDPVPWAILSGDAQIGVSVVTLAEKFDEGKIIAQKKIPIPPDALPDPLRTRLFALGADLLMQAIHDIPMCHSSNTPDVEMKLHVGRAKQPYARRLTRDDGMVPWNIIQLAMDGKDLPQKDCPGLLKFSICHLAFGIERLVRALTPWPGVWTTVETSHKGPASPAGGQGTRVKRLKILSCHLLASLSRSGSHASCLILDSVQLEGKKPVSFAEFQKAYL